MVGKTTIPVLTVNKDIRNKGDSKVHKIATIDCDNENTNNVSISDNE